MLRERQYNCTIFPLTFKVASGYLRFVELSSLHYKSSQISKATIFFVPFLREKSNNSVLWLAILYAMAKYLIILLFLQFTFPPIYGYENGQDTFAAVQDCEQITKVALEQLVDIFRKNDFERLEPVLNTIQSTCGENEFTQRLRIL